MENLQRNGFKFKALISVLGASLLLAGCSMSEKSAKSGLDSGMVPPTASGATLAPIQVPTYPPIGYNPNPNLLASQPQAPIPAPSNARTPQAIPASQVQAQPMLPPSRYSKPVYDPAPSFDKGAYDQGFDRGYNRGYDRAKDDRFQDMRRDAGNPTDIIPNSPLLKSDNVITLQAVGMGVAPESTISPAQALALAKRAAILDAYRQLGEKMYGVRINATDTVKDAIASSSTIKSRLQALIRNAEITETLYKDGLCQVSMEVRLDGRIWYRALTQG